VSLFSSDGQTLFVGQPSPVLASMYRSAAQNIASGGPVQIQFDTSQYQVGHSTAVPAASTSSYSVTPQVSGYYRITASATLLCTAAPASAYVTVLVRVAGSPVGQAVNPCVVNQFVGPCCSLVAYVASGQSITAYIDQLSGAVLTTMTDVANRPKLFVELLR